MAWPAIRTTPALTYLHHWSTCCLSCWGCFSTGGRASLSCRAARGLGWSLLGGGIALNGWFLKTIRNAEVPIRTDRPVPRLTTEGPFRHTRNPSYLALAVIYAGIAILRNSLWAMLLLPLVVMVIQREVIGREERYLERTFGEEYLAYKQRVRRWV
jgi:protein-S-isoprenylcysteine O-methyltransferase Ste14